MKKEKNIERLIEISNYDPKVGLVDYGYEFHLSTEPDLKIGLPFSQQIHTNSELGDRGDMGTTEQKNVIYTTKSPEQWYDQFKLELADAPEFIPNNLYIVKVKNKSSETYLNQAINKPQDVIVIEKIPNKNDNEPDFQKGYLELKKYV